MQTLKFIVMQAILFYNYVAMYVSVIFVANDALLIAMYINVAHENITLPAAYVSAPTIFMYTGWFRLVSLIL